MPNTKPQISITYERYPTIQVPDRVLVAAFMGPLPTKLVDFTVWGRGVFRNITWGAANTDKTIKHGLGRIPILYSVWRSSLGGEVYDGTNLGSDWTPINIVLRNNVLNDIDWIYIL